MKSDEALMEEVRDKDSRDAFAELLSRHRQNVLNYFARSGVEEEAEDLAQRAFLRLWKYRAKYEARAKFSTFLGILIRQERIDELRRRNRRFVHELPENEDTPEPVAAEGTAGPDRADAASDIRAALASLPERLRQVVVLGAFEERPYSEIGEILGIPEGTVKSRMYHALAKMRDFLEKDERRASGGKRQ